VIAHAPPPSNVLVFADEFRLNPSRNIVQSGAVRFQLKNIGEDDHDIAVRRRAANAIPSASPIVRPGKLGELTVRLPAGRYVIFCSVGDHAARGMQGAFTVTRRKPPSRGA
jgi:FtsP/CotA-like multicopper oxidase with cupredoxin domain